MLVFFDLVPEKYVMHPSLGDQDWVLLLPITFKVISFQSWAISAAAGSNLSAVYNWVAAASCEFRGIFLHKKECTSQDRMLFCKSLLYNDLDLAF